MSKPPEHGTAPAWIALVTLPIAMFGYGFLTRIDHGMRAMASLTDPAILQVLGFLLTAMVAVVVGPHLATIGALVGSLLGYALVTAGFTYGGDLHVVSHAGALLGIVASAGVSTTGATPGLRYAVMIAAYAAANVVFLIPETPLPASVGFAVPVALAAWMLVPTLSWWVIRKHPMAPREGATQRSAIVAAAIGLILFASAAASVLFWREVPDAELPLTDLANAGAVLLLGVPLTLLFLVLEATHRPARLGLGAGAGALLISLGAVFAWTTDFLPSPLMGAVIGFGEVLLLPWAYARATSDAHWRVAGLLAVFVLAPRLIEAIPGPLVPVSGALLLAIAAIPIGMLGWVGDEWVFGEEPGSEKARR